MTDASSHDDQSGAFTPMAVITEPDDGPDIQDGLYVTYGYLDMLVRRANNPRLTHCQTCTCTNN